jgi:hypothetical protein
MQVSAVIQENPHCSLPERYPLNGKRPGRNRGVNQIDKGIA